MPSVPPDQLYRGTPFILVDGLRHSVGWQDGRTAGPCFVVTSGGAFGTIKVLQRFPLSEQGWTDAWQVLSSLDASAAAAIEARLAQRDAARRAAAELAALAGRSLCYLRSVTFDGGSDSGSLFKGKHYDLRFQDDRLLVCISDSARTLVELPYADVENVEVSGAGGEPTSVMLGWISGLGLLGAFLGFLVLGLLGLLLGAVVLGLIGAAIAAATSKNESIVRVLGRDAEFQFLDQLKRADDVRRALSEPLMAIRKANAAAAERPNRPAEPASDSVADQLGKLAALLQQDLISRDEFEQLKAKVIAKS
jgi:hypothetical protein